VSMRPPEFSEEDKIKVLLWSDRHCCICGKTCGLNIVIHHIEQKGRDLSDIDNAIPLCFDCHSSIKSYNSEHPLGTSFKIKEVKRRRDQIYETYTRHLIPPIHFEITQSVRDNLMISREFPNVGFTLVHKGIGFLPVNVKVEVKFLLDRKDLGIVKDKDGYYSGETEWNLNPTSTIYGNFTAPAECVGNNLDLKAEVQVTVIDQYRRFHKYLPQAWTYVRKDNYWFLEPRSFTSWK
jgi:hypothetical protein